MSGTTQPKSEPQSSAPGPSAAALGSASQLISAYAQMLPGMNPQFAPPFPGVPPPASQPDPYAAQLAPFWQQQVEEVQRIPSNDPTEFRNHQLPLARIKKIMKSDEDVRMISAEAPVLFAKACELFILELTLRSWLHAEENKRRTLQRNDISAAIMKTDIFDFLIDVVPQEDIKAEGGLPPAAAAVAAVSAASGGGAPSGGPGPLMAPPMFPYPYPGGMPGMPGPDGMMRPPMDPAMLQQMGFQPPPFMPGQPPWPPMPPGVSMPLGAGAPPPQAQPPQQGQQQAPTGDASSQQ